MTSPKQAAQSSRVRPPPNVPAGADAPKVLPPIKPHPVLFVVLGIVLALWLAVLGVMRLTMVNPPTAQPQPTTVPSSLR